ncbi:hypothetical protein BKA61DRAFT_666448 [Leptodontidium sp. MPI-SDFR-AT-0119]|nr:hypothetical protein BKA61DRAFT_666448 [Leptodontidium sp. MPI-SDFR-AT-0119]
MDNTQDDLHPLRSTNDPRTDGISYEIHKASISQYLKTASPGRTLEDLTKPGIQKLKVNCWDAWSCNKTDAFLRALSDTEMSGQGIWDIDVGGNPSCQSNITLLADVVGNLPNVTQLCWNTGWPIPPVLLQSLERNHPACRLYYNLPFSPYGEHEFADDGKRNASETNQYLEEFHKNRTLARQSILNSTNLYSLTASIDYTHTDGSEKMDLIHQALLTCPNIRELDLQVWRSGCYQQSDRSFAFNFEKYNTTIPPLEILKIGGYRFDYPANGIWRWPLRKYKKVLLWPWTKLPAFMIKLAGRPLIHNAGGFMYEEIPSPRLEDLNRTNLDVWLEYMDWSNLHTLEIDSPDEQTLRNLRGDKLHNLKTFSVRGGCRSCSTSDKSILEFLATLSPLESLALVERKTASLDAVLDVIAKHHSTLKSLEFSHFRDTFSKTAYDTAYSGCGQKEHGNNTFLNSTQLTRLFSTCPNLQSLGIEIQTSAEWNYDVFDMLASFPILNSLTLSFVSGERPSSHAEFGYNAQRQHRDEELGLVMIGIKSYLRKSKTGVPFEQLRTFVGSKEFGKVYEVENLGESPAFTPGLYDPELAELLHEMSM